MKKFGKYFLVVRIFLVSFLGNYLKGAKRNLNHIGHTVQNYEFAGSARAWRNNYFNYKNSEEKETNDNNEVKTEKPKTYEQICKEKCLVELDPQKRKACLGLCTVRKEKPLPFKLICKKNCLAERDSRARESCLDNCRGIWGE